MARDYTMTGYSKCRPTGKVSFPTKIEAHFMLQRLKWALVMKRNKVDGSRIKHRVGKLVQRRAYYCDLCQGYHLTRWTKRNYQNYRRAQQKW